MTTLTRSHVAFLATTLLESAPKAFDQVWERQSALVLKYWASLGQLAQTFTLEALDSTVTPAHQDCMSSDAF